MKEYYLVRAYCQDEEESEFQEEWNVGLFSSREKAQQHARLCQRTVQASINDATLAYLSMQDLEEGESPCFDIDSCEVADLANEYLARYNPKCDPDMRLVFGEPPSYNATFNAVKVFKD